jgi:hypothetical protein
MGSTAKLCKIRTRDVHAPLCRVLPSAFGLGTSASSDSKFVPASTPGYMFCFFLTLENVRLCAEVRHLGKDTCPWDNLLALKAHLRETLYDVGRPYEALGITPPWRVCVLVLL